MRNSLDSTACNIVHNWYSFAVAIVDNKNGTECRMHNNWQAGRMSSAVAVQESGQVYCKISRQDTIQAKRGRIHFQKMISVINLYWRGYTKARKIAHAAEQ